MTEEMIIKLPTQIATLWDDTSLEITHLQMTLFQDEGWDQWVATPCMQLEDGSMKRSSIGSFPCQCIASAVGEFLSNVAEFMTASMYQTNIRCCGIGKHFVSKSLEVYFSDDCQWGRWDERLNGPNLVCNSRASYKEDGFIDELLYALAWWETDDTTELLARVPFGREWVKGKEAYDLATAWLWSEIERKH